MNAATYVRTISSLVLAVMCLPATAQDAAQETANLHPNMNSKFTLSIGVFYPEREYGISVDGNLGIPDTDVNVDGGLESSQRDPLFTADFGWKFTERWSLNLQRFTADKKTARSLSEQVEWEDVIYEVGADVLLRTNMAVTRLFFSRDFLKSEGHYLGIGAGIHALDLGVAIEGQATLDDQSTEFRRESVNVAVPLPNLGIWYRYSPSKKWLLEARVDWLDVSFDEVSGSLTDLRLSANYAFTEHFGIGISYQHFSIDADISKNNWLGAMDIAYTGPGLNVTAYW